MRPYTPCGCFVWMLLGFWYRGHRRMRTLDRYVIRETVMPFLLALAVLTFLFAISPMMDRAQLLLTAGAPARTIVYLLINLLPQALGITLPMALLIGLLMALGRLSADRESVAFLACGVSLWRLLRPAIGLSVVVGLATLWVMIEGIPQGNRTFQQGIASLVAEKSAADIKPGVFYEGFPGKVLYVQGIRKDGTWERVLLAADNGQGLPTLALANEGQLVMDKDAARVEIILRGVTQTMPGAEPGVYVVSGGIASQQISIDPKQVYGQPNIGLGMQEMTIRELREEIALNIKNNESTHGAVILIHQKFSFPVACLVMGILAVAVGVHTRKDGKFASFALGLALIFVYYVLMIVFGSMAKSQQFPAAWARWVPNIVLGAASLWLMWWRSSDAERSVSFALPQKLLARFQRTDGDRRAATVSTWNRPILVIRFPKLGLPWPRLVDSYLMRRYINVLGLAFVALLVLFYVSTIVDLSDKLFKSHVTTTMFLSFLWYSTPQIIYFVIPIAVLVAVLVSIGGLAKTNELTVLRACGVSLYRLAVPLVLLGAVWSGVLFGLEEYVLAASNKQKSAVEDVIKQRPSHLLGLANRHWLVGTGNRVYYYTQYDKASRSFVGLSVYDILPNPYRVIRHTYAPQVVATRNGWVADGGWKQEFPRSGVSRREVFKTRRLQLDPAKYFETDAVDAQAMTVGQLRKHVSQLKTSGLSVGTYEVDMHRKIAFPLMAIVMTLIALPFGVTTGKRGAMYGIGLAIALAFTYQIAFTAFGYLGAASLLPAAVAAWAPNVLFLAGASYLLLSVRT